MSVFPVFVDERISVCYHPVDPQQLRQRYDKILDQ